MRREEIISKLADYVRTELVEDEGRELNEETPLLQWGILDSMGIVNLLAFIEEDFGIEVPDDGVRPEHFETLGKLSDMLVGLRQAA